MTDEKVHEKTFVSPRRFVEKPRHGGFVRVRHVGREEDAWVQYEVHRKGGDPYVARRTVQRVRSDNGAPRNCRDRKEESGGKDVVHGFHFSYKIDLKKEVVSHIFCITLKCRKKRLNKKFLRLYQKTWRQSILFTDSTIYVDAKNIHYLTEYIHECSMFSGCQQIYRNIGVILMQCNVLAFWKRVLE